MRCACACVVRISITHVNVNINSRRYSGAHTKHTYSNMYARDINAFDPLETPTCEMMSARAYAEAGEPTPTATAPGSMLHYINTLTLTWSVHTLLCACVHTKYVKAVPQHSDPEQ